VQGIFARSPAALDERCATFVHVQAWPLLGNLDWKGWLTNFSDQKDLFFARCLLESFLYYNVSHSEALLLHAFHALSREVCVSSSNDTLRRDLWREFLSRVIITYVEGETPSPTDSGLAFARRGRILLGIPQARILSPELALATLVAEPSIPIVFLDDFLGSGKQFEHTWHRTYGAVARSFATVASQGNSSIWYIPLFATAYGIRRVTPITIGASIRPAHVLSERFPAFSDESDIWPEGQHDEGRAFVERASVRAGYSPPGCWGFHSLGLCIAVTDTIPDASLPLFYSERNGWHPLMARR
jgi:hypothetical protein